MKIVHLGNVPLLAGHPDFNRVLNHPGRWVLNHAVAQKRFTGMDVEVVTITHKTSCDFTMEVEGVKVHYLKQVHPMRHLTFFAIEQFRVARYVRKLCPDIVHAHGTEADYALAAIRTGLPFCVTAQGLIFLILEMMKDNPSLAQRIQCITENYSWRHTQYGIAKSEYVHEVLARQYPHLDLTLIPNTYETILEAPLEAPAQAPRLAYVGTMDRRKGIHVISDAMLAVAKAFPDVELWVFGNFNNPAGYEAEQIQRLREILGDRLLLHGRIASDKLFSKLRQCKVLLAPSLEEMFGNQLIEALMCGCHGIVAEGTALAENAVRFGNATVVPQEDSVALAGATIAALQNPPSREECESARRRICDYMGPQSVAQKHETLYKRILA